MKKQILLGFLIILILLAAALAGFVYFCVIPFQASNSAMPADGKLIIHQDAFDQLHMTWPEAKNADYYCIELQLPMTQEATAAEKEPTVIYRDYVYGTSYILPKVPDTQEVVIQVSTIVEFESGLETQRREGDNPIRVTTTLAAPTLEDLQFVAYPDADTVTITYQPRSATHSRIYQRQSDGSLTLLDTLEGAQRQFSFGDGKELAMPEYGEPCTLVFDAYRIEERLEFYGYPSANLTVAREDLLDRELNLTITEEGNNVYTMQWNETKGEYYHLQQYDNAHNQWHTLARIPKDGERKYTTDHLRNLSDYTFRVVAVGGQTNEGSSFAAQSQEVSVKTVASPIYCTMWPVKDLSVFSAPSDGKVIGKLKTAKAYCVLDQKDSMFGVMVDGQLGYVDSRYCMINLPELYGDLISYDITNSYSSIYMVHEYEIPDVTVVITAGYERVQMATGEFLVPLLYPTAQKLQIAAQNALSQGYRLKIYDAYRPNKATLEIYNLTEKILDEPIPDKTFTGKKLTDLPKVKKGEEITYELLMTNGTWKLGSFLAKGGSLHNLGIAVDLTLEDLEGNELQMQSSMHDLSCYSVLAKNNANAKLLAKIMTGAGLGGISSEWWHFQDNEIRSQITLPTVASGVSPECWMANDHGWRYRRYNGTFLADCTKNVDGVTYNFDIYGYATKAE